MTLHHWLAAGMLLAAGLAHAGDGAEVAMAPDLQAALPASGDYYVEARIRAVKPASASGQLYLLGRRDGANWAGAGLSIAHGTLDVNLVRMQDGVLSRLKQVRRMPAVEGRWDQLRLEMTGPVLTVYLNGELLNSVRDPAFAQLRGAAGFYSKGDAFAVEQLRAGPASDKPARIALAASGDAIRLQAGDAPRLLAISALAGDGLARIAYTASSDAPQVAAAGVTATGVSVTPRQPGTARVVVASVADPFVQTTLTVTVEPRFVMPAAAPGASVTPADGERDVPADTPLRIALSHPPVLGSTGSVRIFRKRDHALVDVIEPGEDIAALGPAADGQRRLVRRSAITVAGNAVVIAPHGGVLVYDTEYEAALGAGVVDGVTGRWSFRTRRAAPAGTTLTVDDDGPADFRTVQGALDHAMASYPRAQPLSIEVRNGSYEELLFLRGHDRVTIRGESRDGVVIHATNNEGLNFGSGASQTANAPAINGGRALLLVEDADLLTLQTLTLRNTTQRRHTLSAQAETIHFNSDAGRLVAREANFFSEQDTLQLKGYAWFYRTLVAGNVDFIWGANRAALFEQSEIRSIGDSANPASGGYVVQARTVAAGDKGFVFVDSTLTHGAGPAGNDVAPGSTYLARSPGTAGTWDNVSFISCRIDRHVAAVGWAGAGVKGEPGPNPARADALHGWREYGSTDLAGAALALSQRAGGFVLDAAAAQRQFGSRKAVFASFDGGKGWDPKP